MTSKTTLVKNIVVEQNKNNFYFSAELVYHERRSWLKSWCKTRVKWDTFLYFFSYWKCYLQFLLYQWRSESAYL